MRRPPADWTGRRPALRVPAHRNLIAAGSFVEISSASSPIFPSIAVSGARGARLRFLRDRVERKAPGLAPCETLMCWRSSRCGGGAEMKRRQFAAASAPPEAEAHCRGRNRAWRSAAALRLRRAAAGAANPEPLRRSEKQLRDADTTRDNSDGGGRGRAFAMPGGSAHSGRRRARNPRPWAPGTQPSHTGRRREEHQSRGTRGSAPRERPSHGRAMAWRNYANGMER